MSPKKRQPRISARVKTPSFPRWLIVVGVVGAALLAYIGTRGGPGPAWQELNEAVGHAQPPRIVSLQQKRNDRTKFIVSIENPSLRRVQIIAYEAEPAIQNAAAIEPAPGAGSLPVMKADEEGTVACNRSRRFPLAVPLVIESKSSGGLEVQPWTDECDFAVRVEATSGISLKGYWSPKTEVMLREMRRTNQPVFEAIILSASPAFQEHLRQRGITTELR